MRSAAFAIICMPIREVSRPYNGCCPRPITHLRVRVFMKRIGSLIVLVWSLVAWSVGAQPVPGRYIVEFDSEPAMAAASIAARRPQLRAEHLVHEAAIRALGGNVLRRYDTAFNGMAVQISDQRAAQLRALPGVRGVYADKLWRPVLDQAVLAHRVTDAWATLNGGASNAGAGVMIAVLDEGIDVNHPGFQSFPTAVPSGFPLVSSDAEKPNTNNKIIVSRDYTRSGGKDTGGHGTGVAMIAAGLTNTASI